MKKTTKETKWPWQQLGEKVKMKAQVMKLKMKQPTYLMALEDEDSTQDEITTRYEELESAFHELQDEFRKVCAKNNVLKKSVASLSINVKELKKEKIILKNDFYTISNEKATLKNNVDDLTETLENFVKSRDNLNMLLGN